MSQLDRPAIDEIEVSILGGGNGYGECIVMHTGFDYWLIVDSALNPNTRKPLALECLENIGVDSKENVKFILATHWHDDHVKGLSEIVEVCENSRLAFSQALQKKQFLILLGQSEKIKSSNSGAEEFRKIFERLEKSGRKPIRAIQDRTLIHQKLSKEIQLNITSLSPSDDAILFFESQLGKLIEEASPTKVYSDVRPNLTSVVLNIQIEEDQVCLSGDLENTSNPKMGWQAILNAQLIPRETISVFKVPHHGSINAYCPDFWNYSMMKNPIAGLTPYARGRKKLPSKEDIQNIYRHTSSAYITALPKGGKVKKRDPKVNKVIKSLGYDVKEIPYSFGHIRIRKKINAPVGNWSVNCIGEAIELRACLNKL